MILSGDEIQAELGKNIFLEPYNTEQLNPNSYNLKLHNELLIYNNFPLDMKKSNSVSKLEIPANGLVLEPGTLYLGRTHEKTITRKFVPMLEGRSSVGRLGMFVHVSAGFGDVGFDGYWTLEILVTHPLKIYPFVEICQIFYHSVKGDISKEYQTKYQKNKGIQASMMFKDFES
ncbi:MAG: dCTP deaminase [Actinobacteria bacterium]|nr:dCTP deaminase [Actinomycetota bacterium]